MPPGNNVVCPQGIAAAERTVQGFIDPRLWSVEEFPLQKRPPDPAPPAPPVPPITPGSPPSSAWSSVDCWWWATALRALPYLPSDAPLQRTLAARGSFRNYGRQLFSDSSPILGFFWAQMQDRFYVGIHGQRNSVQALQLLFTFGYGSQALAAGAYWNSAFVANAATIAAAVINPFVAAGKPPLCVLGHSYGAGVAPIVANVLGAPRPDGFDRVVTFGAPRSFTASALALQAGGQLIRVINQGDNITMLPPPRAIMAYLSGVITLGNYPGGDYSASQPGQLFQTSPGITPVIDLNPSPADWASQFFNWLVSGAQKVPHYISTYANKAQQWVNSDVSFPPPYAGYDNYAALYSVNSDLAAAGY